MNVYSLWKAEKRTFCLFTSDCHFHILLGFHFQNTAGLGLERKRKERKTTAGGILSRWSFSLLHFLWNTTWFYFEKWMLKARSSIHECHKYFSKCFPVDNTGMFLRYFISQKTKKKSKLPTKPPSTMIFLLSTYTSNLCLLSCSISVQTCKKTSCGHWLDDWAVEIGIFLKFTGCQWAVLKPWLHH